MKNPQLDREIYNILQESPYELEATEIATRLRLPYNSNLRRVLASMRSEGKIKNVGKHRPLRWTVEANGRDKPEVVVQDFLDSYISMKQELEGLRHEVGELKAEVTRREIELDDLKVQKEGGMDIERVRDALIVNGE